MKTIFENETVIGRCSKDWIDDSVLELCGEEFGTLYVQSSAYLNGTKNLLRIEQRCCLRLGEELAEQPWVKARLHFEPVVGSEQEMVEKMKEIHEEFVSKARAQIPDRCWA